MDTKKTAIANAQAWLTGNYDDDTKAEVHRMMSGSALSTEFVEAFYRSLEFGTGGLRGIMGVGTNRMNVYTVGMATQGLANYLKLSFVGRAISCVVSYDCRNNSALFADTVARVMASNGFTVYLFDALRPTPELSYAIRHLGCQSGVMITASHNPKEYNGYKAYWEDGGQVTAPHDTNIIDQVNMISDISQVRGFDASTSASSNSNIDGCGVDGVCIGKIIRIGEEVDAAYLKMIRGLSLSPEAVARHSDLKIVYTPIHGTGVRLVPMALESYGFKNILHVAAQDVVDGNFPTVVSPNPEEPAAMKMGVELAVANGADIVMATDPDADRQALAVRNHAGEFVLLNGNQTGALLTYYVLARHKELGMLKGNEFVVKTIVTTELIARIAESFGVKYYDVLTGFKFIAQQIRESGDVGGERFLCGGEESFGFLIGDAVRDKDAVASLSMAAECAAWAADNGKSVFDLLCDLYIEYGFYKEGLVSITRKGIQGIQEIQLMMHDMRTNPPALLGGSRVVEVRDYQQQIVRCIDGNTRTLSGLPKSDVLQFLTEDHTIVSVRPSGTEPKIKFYFGVRACLTDRKSYNRVNAELDIKIAGLKQDLGL